MADEVTRLITSIEIKGAAEHDAALTKSIGMVNAYADAASGKIANVERATDSLVKVSNAAASAGGTVAAGLEKITTAAQPVAAELEKVGFSAANSFGTISNTSRSSLQDVTIWGDGISTTVRKFTTDLGAAQPAFSSVGTAAQTAGQTVASSTAAAATGLAGMSQVAAASATAFVPISSNATEAGAKIMASASNALSGLQGLASGTVATGSTVDALRLQAEGLSGQIISNSSTIQAWAGEVAGSRVRMAELKNEVADAVSKFGANSTQVQALKSEYANLSNATALTSAQQRALSVENSALTGSLRTVETAQKALTNVTLPAGQSALSAMRAEQALALAEVEAAGAADKATSAFMRKTSMINTGTGPLRGYDALTQALARSMGGIPVAAALAIPLLAALAEALFKGNSETEKAIQLNKEQIVLDAVRHQQLQTGNLFTTEWANRLNDINALNSQLKQSVGELNLAQLQENDAVRGYSTSTAEAASGIDDFQLKLGLYIKSLFESTKSETEATAARVEASAKVEEQINARIRLAAETGKTRDALIAELSAIIKNKDEINALTAALDAGALAQARYRAGQGVLGAARTKVAEEAAEAGVTLTHAEAVKRLNVELTKQGEETYKLAQVTLGTEKNMKAFTETTKKAGSAGHAAMSQYKDGVEGLDKAFNRVVSGLASGSFSQIFEDLPKKARAGAEQMKKAAEEVVKSINDILKREHGGTITIDDSDIKLAMSSLQGLGAEGVRNLKAVSEAVKFVEEKLSELAASSVDTKPKVIEISTEIGKLLNPATGGFTKAGQEIVDKIHSIHAEAKIVFPGTGKLIEDAGNKVETFGTQILVATDKFADPLHLFPLYARESANAAGAIEDFGKSFLIALDHESKFALKAMGDAPNWAGAIVDQAERVRKALSGDLPDAAGAASIALIQMRAALDIHSNIDSAISDIERYGEMTHETSAQIAADIDKQFQAWVNAGITTRAELDKILEAHKRAANQLPGIWETVFKDLDSGARKGLNDVFGVIATMPGAWGDALRKSQSEVEKWLSFLDASTKLLQRILGQQETGIKGFLNTIVGLFKHAQEEIKFSADGISDSAGLIIKNFDTSSGSGGFGSVLNDLQKTSGALSDLGESGAHSLGGLGAAAQSSSSTMQSALGAASAALGAFMTGLSTANATGSKTFGAIAGGLQGAMQGFMVAGPWGALAGGVAGILGGLFGGGKSAAQKQAEALQTKKLQDDIAKDANAILSGALDNIKKALEIGPLIAEFEGVGKKQIDAVFKFMTRLVNHFIEASKSWNSANLTSAKAAAENITPVFEAIAAVPQAATAINSTFDVSDVQIGKTFSILDRIVAAWETEADKWLNGKANRIKKVAEKLAPAVNLVSPLSEAITDINKVEMPAPEKFSIVDAALDTIITFFNGLADKYAKPVLKAIENLGTKLGPVISAEKETIGLIKDTVDLPMPKASDAANLANGMRLFIDSLISSFADFKTEGLATLAAIIIAVAPVASGVKAWTETATAVRDYSEVGTAKWQMVADDIRNGTQMIHLLESDARAIADEAAIFDADMQDFSTHAIHGMQTYADTLNAMASISNGVLANLNFTQPPGTVGGESSSFGALSLGQQNFAPTSFAPPTAPAAPGGSQSSQTVNVAPGAMELHIHLPEGVTASEGKQIGEQVVEAVKDLMRQNKGRAQSDKKHAPVAAVIDFFLKSSTS